MEKMEVVEEYKMLIDDEGYIILYKYDNILKKYMTHKTLSDIAEFEAYKDAFVFYNKPQKTKTQMIAGVEYIIT